MTLSRIRPPGRLFSPAECEAIANQAAGYLRGTPPVENSKAVGGPSAADGQGVCTFVTLTFPSKFSNLDKTRSRIVRKGNTVRMGSFRGRVVRVRTGNAIVDWAGGGKGDCKACSLLEVLL